MKKLPIKPPRVMYVLIMISVVLHISYPIKKIFDFPYSLLGSSLLLLGILTAVWGRTTFRKFDTPLSPGEKPKKFVLIGPYKITRNPMYLGLLLLTLGIAIILGSVSAFFSPVVFFLILNFGYIPFEERLMKKTFGKKYLKYKEKVRRWV